MKPVISYGIVNADTSGPGAFLRAAKWYWDELADMFSAAGFTSVMIPMVPNTENVARNGAPICTASIRTRFGSPEGYRYFLNERGIDNVEIASVSAQSFYNSLFETGLAMDHFFDGFFEYAMDVAEALIKMGGSTLLISPTPGIGFLKNEFCSDTEKMQKFTIGAAECINRIGKECGQYALNVVIRNEFWTQPRGDCVRDFLNLLDSASVSYVPDPGHLFIAGADYRKILKEYARQMKIASFTDTRYRDETGVYQTISPEFPQDGRSQRVYYDMGFGEIDFDDVYGILLEAGFDGSVLLEPKYSLDIPKGILRARTFWNQLIKKNAGKGIG